MSERETFFILELSFSTLFKIFKHFSVCLCIRDKRKGRKLWACLSKLHNCKSNTYFEETG